MKNTIIILVIVALFGGAVVYQNNKARRLSQETLVGHDSQPSDYREDLAPVKDGNFTIDSTNSKANWTGKKTIKKDWIDTGTIALKEGNFSITDGMISSGKVIFDMNSISVDMTGSGGGQDKLSTHLKSNAFFDVEKFPEATFAFTKHEAGNLIGDLTIKGVTKSISIPATVSSVNNKTHIQGKAVIDRTLFNVKFGSNKFFDDLKDNVIDDTFNLEFDVVAQ